MMKNMLVFLVFLSSLCLNSTSLPLTLLIHVYAHAKELRAPLRQMLTLVIKLKLYLVLVFLCDILHSIAQCEHCS